ncbi:MAG: amidohydrolase [Clostridia bacterium]|nr:amidohydrolase [Clostridia bacterium]
MEKLMQGVEKHKKLILDAERYIWAHPETGYKEVETSKYMEEKFVELGYDIVKAENITGFYTVLDTGKPGPTVLIFAELDSIICPAHPESDKETGAVHSCGHNAQCAGLLGVAAALKEEGALDGLSGRIKLCAVPAEELLEIGYRRELQQKGIIKYMGGKTEFLYRGYFDDVDIVYMIHAGTENNVHDGANGCIAKNIIYKGVAAHAGGNPWNGRNALYAATCGINAANAVRETFHDTDLIRFHPIITKGGDMVNAIPETVQIESYVRGKSYDAMLSANKKVNQALIGAAYSIDTNVEIIDIPGYAPLENSSGMRDLYLEGFKLALPDEEVFYRPFYTTGSTDMGDMSQIFPTVHPHMKGADGKGHGNNYQIVDPINLCVNSAKVQLAMLWLLLKDDAKRAKEIIKNFKPNFTKQSYLDYVDKINVSGDRIKYKENGAEII